MSILVTVIDREILLETFENYSEAYEKMKKEFHEALEKSSPAYGDFNKVSAWVNGRKETNYDWVIYEA